MIDRSRSEAAMVNGRPLITHRWSRRVVAAACAVLIAAGMGTGAAQASPASHNACPAAVAGSTDLGRLAFIDNGQLKLVDLASCRVTTLVTSGVEPPVRWSADGEYLAYGSGSVISAGGGTPSHPLGQLASGWAGGASGWVWSPGGHELAGVTAGGGVEVGGPAMTARRLLRNGWGATSIAWSPTSGQLAVSRSLYLKSAPPYRQQIWLLNPDSIARKLLWHLHKPKLAPAWLAGFSPDGQTLLAWEDSQNSASLAADGVPLVAIPVDGGKPVALGDELLYSDFLSWCGPDSLAYVLDNGGREVSLGDRIDLAGAPSWSATTPADPGKVAHLSFISPACSPATSQLPAGFMIAAAVGPATPDLPFGHEHRSIWLMSNGGDWARLEPAPPAGATDELPMWSHDGQWLAFIRTAWSRASIHDDSGEGELYLLDLGAHFDGHTTEIGPIANLGVAASYYGHYGWSSQVAWYSG